MGQTSWRSKRNVNIKKFVRKKYVSIKVKIVMESGKMKNLEYFKINSENIIIRAFKKYF